MAEGAVGGAITSQTVTTGAMIEQATEATTAKQTVTAGTTIEQAAEAIPANQTATTGPTPVRTIVTGAKTNRTIVKKNQTETKQMTGRSSPHSSGTSETHSPSGTGDASAAEKA